MKTNLLVIGLIATASVSCVENDILSEQVSVGATLDIEVGGESQPNRVFVDLSQDMQTPVARDSWDFGFYSGLSNTVILNESVGMLAYKLDKNDLLKVTAEDTLKLGERLSLEAIFAALFQQETPPWLEESINWADNPSGDLTKTAIKLSEQTELNSVYIVNRGKNSDGSERGWKKVKPAIVDGIYQMQFADINSNEISSHSVTKSSEANFRYINLEEGEINVEPPKDNWDIAFTTYLQILNFGTDFPYGVKDWVIQNRSTSITEIIVASEDQLSSFENFSLTDIEGLTFRSSVDAIGGEWRTVASPTPGSITGVRDDRFYIIKDAKDNYYKLIFTGMLSDTGERGYPQVQYNLLK